MWSFWEHEAESIALTVDRYFQRTTIGSCNAEGSKREAGSDTIHDHLQATLRAHANIERARAGLGKAQKCLTNMTVGMAT